VPTPKDPTVLMSKVVLDEPEGYRGRRRRFLFPFTRRAGGAALPALLVAASVVVVLIVVGVSQLLPKQAAGQIPFGTGTGTDNATPDDDGRLVGPDVTNGPSASGSVRPSRSASPKASGASASAGVPGSPKAAPTTTTPGNPVTFNPVAVEAEAHNGGSAKPGTCSGCSGGSKVRFIGRNSGWVTFTGINVPQAMNLQVTVVYVCGACVRTYYISVNGGTPVTITPAATADWNTTNSVFVTLSMPAGVDSIKFYNPNSTADAPDLDRILIKTA